MLFQHDETHFLVTILCKYQSRFVHNQHQNPLLPIIRDIIQQSGLMENNTDLN